MAIPTVDVHARLSLAASQELDAIAENLHVSRTAALSIAISRMHAAITPGKPLPAVQKAAAAPLPQPKHCPDCSHALVPGEPHTCNFD